MKPHFKRDFASCGFGAKALTRQGRRKLPVRRALSPSRWKRALPLWAVLVPLFYLPVVFILYRVVGDPAGRAALAGFLRDPVFRRTLGFTFWESLLSAVGSIALSLPGAYFLGRFDFPGKRALRSLLVLPFVLPSILAVLAMVVAYGNNGLLNQFLRAAFGPRAPQFTGLYGLGGIVLTHVFFNFALGIRLIGEALERLD
ncbi:MAG: ABC transporter permease, partial [Bacteroidota bacterium]